MTYNRIFLFTLLSVLVVLSSCSQTATGIYKTASYYKINTPGTIPVDDSGNEIGRNRDTIREIYIVTRSVNAPTVIAVVISQQYYTAFVSKIDSNKIYIGEKLPDNQRVELNAGEGYSLWKIRVGEPMSDVVINNYKSTPQFYLDIRYKGKSMLHKIKSSIELVPELHY